MAFLTLQPYYRWKTNHAKHHATSNNLDERRFDREIFTMTRAEYEALSPKRQLLYRIYRNRLVLCLLLPLPVFWVEPRLWWRGKDERQRQSMIYTNLNAIGWVALILAFDLTQPFLWIWAPASWMAGGAGLFLFYIQHQFEGVNWKRKQHWSIEQASLEGASWLALPVPLAWITGWIGIHHVHHLNPRIPMYHLARSHESLASSAHRLPRRLTLGAALKPIGELWDEEAGSLVSAKSLVRTG